jgi:hypothetical protein
LYAFQKREPSVFFLRSWLALRYKNLRFLYAYPLAVAFSPTANRTKGARSDCSKTFGSLFSFLKGAGKKPSAQKPKVCAVARSASLSSPSAQEKNLRFLKGLRFLHFVQA